MKSKGFINKLLLRASGACLLHALTGCLIGPVILDYGMSRLYVPEGKTSEPVSKSMRADVFSAGLNDVLKQHKQKHVLVGDNNHCDMRPLSYLADPKVMKVLAKNSITDIFLELGTDSQPDLNKVLTDKSYTFPHSNSICGEDIGAEKGQLITNAIRNAHAVGIKVHAADSSSRLLGAVWGINMMAVLTEGLALSAIGLEQAGGWWIENAGMKPFLANRMDDRLTASFITANTSKAGRSLTFYGLGHVQAPISHGMRAQLPDNLALAFNDPKKDNLGEKPDYEGWPNRLPVSYVINLDNGKVNPYAQHMNKAKAMSQVSAPQH